MGGIQIGDVDVASQIIENEFRLAVLERVVDVLAHYITVAGGPPLGSHEIDIIRKDVVESLKKKYPNSGISLKELK